MDLTKLSEQAKKRNSIHSSYFKKISKKQLRELDDQVHELHHEVFQEIDCLECAHCCRTLGPRLTDKDIEKMAAALRMKPSDVVSRYLKIDEDQDYVFQSMPCPFLAPDNYCLIYEDRPKACREYPHTDRKKFFQIHKLTLKNAATCPAVFELLERLVNDNK